MHKIHQQIKARRDLKNIWLYSYENFGIDQADKYFDDLESAMETIQDNPLIGVSCDYIRAGYRQYKVNEHYIFYHITKKTIHIVRVLHDTMQTRNHL
ncbi:MAG: type II toxin-antitoxin system RelE/ParE family toxin [Candidatus Thiodiazotropha sp.]